MLLRLKKKDKWFLESGCLRHMTRDQSKFAFLIKNNGGYVRFGDNAKERIIRYGNVGNNTSLIENVLLVDGLKHNLEKFDAKNRMLNFFLVTHFQVKNLEFATKES